jgi:hypothetical protein
MVLLCSIKTGKMSLTCYHKDDFGFDDYWHFFASSHGRDACNRIGGTIMKLARKGNLQNAYKKHIMTPGQLYMWAVVMNPSVTFKYCTVEDHICTKMTKLEEMFRKARSLPGTQKYTVSLLPQITKFRQKGFQMQCVQHHVYSTLARQRQSSGRN